MIFIILDVSLSLTIDLLAGKKIADSFLIILDYGVKKYSSFLASTHWLTFPEIVWPSVLSNYTVQQHNCTTVKKKTNK